MSKEWRPEGWENPHQVMLDVLKDYNHIPSQPNIIICGDLRDIDVIIAEAKEHLLIYEAGADAMHRADVDWLIQRIAHDDRGHVFNMNSKEWLEFIKR